MIFANVTDISIPEGNVIKIHETNSGKVLWEKKKKVLSAHWELSTYDAGSNPAGATIHHWLDTGSELIQTCSEYEGDEYSYRYYNPVSNTFSTIHNMTPSLDNNGNNMNFGDWAIDPVTKVWCSVVNSADNYYYCSAFNDDTYRTGAIRANRCCWSEALNRFCLTGRYGSCLMDTKGKIYEKNDSSAPGQVLPYKTASFALCAGKGTTKFIAYNPIAISDESRSDAIVISPDGYEWTYIEKISNDLPDSTSKLDRGLGVTWVPPLNAYIAFVGNLSGYYVFKSIDGINWTQITIIPPSEGQTTSTGLSRAIDGAYSPEKNIVAFFAGHDAYISDNCINWIKITAHKTGVFSGYTNPFDKFFIWSKSLNAFLYGAPIGEFRKLVID